MPSTLYHATTRDFDAFDDAWIGSNPETHANSNLGIWFAVEPDWISGFGRRVIEAEVDLGCSYELKVSLLAKLSHRHTREPEIFAAMRRSLMERGYDSVAIVELDGRVAMHVVLRAASIKSIKDLAPAPTLGTL